MRNQQKEKAALRQDKLLNQTTKAKLSIEQARAHLLGVCLLDSHYLAHLPTCITLTSYGRLTVAMIKQGLGLEAMAWHLENVGMIDANQVLTGAIKGVPDHAELALVFHQALRVVLSHE